MTRRTAGDSEETWARIVGAARRALSEGGIRALSLRAVAKRAGHRLGTLQYYFPKRADLIEAALGEQYRRLDEFIEDAGNELEEGRPLPDVAAAITVEFYRVARRHPWLCRARVATNLTGSEMSLQSRRALASAVSGIQRSSPTPLDSHELALGLHTMSVLLLRYGSHLDGELMEITGADTPEEAVAKAERHLAETARRIAAGVEQSQPLCGRRAAA